MKKMWLSLLSLASLCSIQAMYQKIPQEPLDFTVSNAVKGAIVGAATVYYRTYHEMAEQHKSILHQMKKISDPQGVAQLQANMTQIKKDIKKAEVAFFERIKIPHNSPWLIGHSYYFTPARQTPEEWYTALEPYEIKDLAKNYGFGKNILRQLPK